MATLQPQAISPDLRIPESEIILKWQRRIRTLCRCRLTPSDGILLHFLWHSQWQRCNENSGPIRLIMLLMLLLLLWLLYWWKWDEIGAASSIRIWLIFHGDSLGCFGILWDFEGFLWDALRIARDFKLLTNLSGFWGIFWDLLWILGDSFGFFGIFRDF